MHRTVSLSLAVLALSLVTGPALAKSYAPVPALEGKNTALKIRFIKYTGGSTGKMIVEVKNTGKQGERFKAKGLFFVPHGDPESAPQRLGAAGPYDVKEQNSWRRTEDMEIPPGVSKRLRLQVFCIDSHRGSPGEAQGFSVARQRLPSELRSKIDQTAKQIIRKNKGDVDASSSEIQGEVWKTRDKKWIKLQGERKHEKSSSRQRSRQQINQAPQRIESQSLIR